MTETHLQVYPTVTTLSAAAAELFERTVREAVRRDGRFLAALSGGNTPVPFFRLLARPPYRERLPWSQMHFFWADERCVPPEDPESNYGQARAKLFAQVPLPEANLHRVQGELGMLLAARAYRAELRHFAAAGLAWPRFDFVLLGLGSDGHTASLFPGSKAGNRPGQGVIAATGIYQGRPAERVSLTPQAINAARRIVFLVSGEEKAEAMAATCCGPSDPLRWPAQRVRPSDGKLLWLVDEAAARLLRK